MSRVSNGAQNGVIAYGLDEFGNYMPLPASSAPNFVALRSLQKKMSDRIQTQGSTALTGNFVLDVVEDRPVFIHGFYITTTMDSDGLYPLNADGVGGMNLESYFQELKFVVDDEVVVNFQDGYIANLASLTQTAPPFVSTIVPPAVPYPFRFVGGFVEVGKIVKRYITDSVQLVNDGSGTANAWMNVQCVYSPMEFSV
jgi:hypothetical protein